MSFAALIISAELLVKARKSGSVVGIILAMSGPVIVIFPPVILPPDSILRATPS
jgi:hypothetical protein